MQENPLAAGAMSELILLPRRPSQCGGGWLSVNKNATPIITALLIRWLAIWLSGNALTSIKVVALRQTRLVPGSVTVCGQVNHLGM